MKSPFISSGRQPDYLSCWAQTLRSKEALVKLLRDIDSCGDDQLESVCTKVLGAECSVLHRLAGISADIFIMLSPRVLIVSLALLLFY